MSKTKSRQMLNKIIDNAEYCYPNNGMLHGAWIEGNYQFCTDSYRAVCLYDPVNVKMRDEWHVLSIVSKFEHAEQTCSETIKLPPASEIKKNINDLIGRKYKSFDVVYRLGNSPELAAVNAKYLVECMECIGATSLKYNPLRPKTDMLLMETDLGKAILLPMYTNGNVGYWIRERR